MSVRSVCLQRSVIHSPNQDKMIEPQSVRAMKHGDSKKRRRKKKKTKKREKKKNPKEREREKKKDKRTVKKNIDPRPKKTEERE